MELKEMKEWFAIKNSKGFEDVFQTKRLICFGFDGESTTLKTDDGASYIYLGDQRKNIYMAIGKEPEFEKTIKITDQQ